MICDTATSARRPAAERRAAGRSSRQRLTLSGLRVALVPLLFAARQRFTLEWQAEKARRFVCDFEASGRGWLWETNADGSLLVSEPPPRISSRRCRLIGRRFEEVLLLDCGDEEDGDGPGRSAPPLRRSRSTKWGSATAAEDVWWSLSRNPISTNDRFITASRTRTPPFQSSRSEA